MGHTKLQRLKNNTAVARSAAPASAVWYRPKNSFPGNIRQQQCHQHSRAAPAKSERCCDASVRHEEAAHCFVFCCCCLLCVLILATTGHYFYEQFVQRDSDREYLVFMPRCMGERVCVLL